MNPPAGADELYQVAIANELVQQRSEVLDSPADQIATQTIDRYLDLKRRFRL